MRLQPARGRAGITLTEILISIMIMGVGLISLATLFPVGLERIRQAQRSIRSAQLVRSALADVESRNLFGTWGYQVNPWVVPSGRDPWITDYYVGMTAANPAVYRGPGIVGGPYIPGEGLPVAYDPLWWAQVSSQDPAILPNATATFDATRFARGPTLRNDPDGGAASAYGLQRLTTIEFLAFSAALQPYTFARAAQVFATQDDPVLQTEGEATVGQGQGSPILPYIDPTTGQTFNDWTYTWMFTGRRSGVTSGTYIGDIVVFHNRPFGFDTVTDSGGTAQQVPAGDRVVEAVFGYGTTVTRYSPGFTDRGYSPQDRTVLLRWPEGEPDPDVRVGSWIADVTYELVLDTSFKRFYPKLYPGQRCHWYRIVRRGDAEDDPNVSGYRRMVVTTESPVEAKTEIFSGTGEPVHLNAALVNPYVVYVFPKIFQAR